MKHEDINLDSINFMAINLETHVPVCAHKRMYGIVGIGQFSISKQFVLNK